MVDVWLPYGKSEVCARIPARNFLGSIEPKEKPSVSDAQAELLRALREPMGSKSLGEIAKPESKVAIVVNDATRPSPSSLMVSVILDELRGIGVKEENITIIFACGIHRSVTPEEAVKLLGQDFSNRVKTISHDPRAPDLVHVGTTKQGTKVLLNKAFVEADVRILTGDICLHYFAGYGGGRKSVLPGVAGEETIKHNHAMLLEANARAGNLDGNPVNEDMVEAARMVKVDFILNVVTNSKREIVKAFAGNLEKAFLEGVGLVNEMYRVKVDRRADVVVVSAGGEPLDLNLFQAYKAVDNALEVVKRGGVIVLVAELAEGHGNQDFYDWMSKYNDLKLVEREIKRNFVIGGSKAYYYLKALQKARIILVSSMPDYYAASAFKLKTARAVNNALSLAFDAAGSNAKVWVLPLGSLTLPEVVATEEQVVSAKT